VEVADYGYHVKILTLICPGSNQVAKNIKGFFLKNSYLVYSQIWLKYFLRMIASYAASQASRKKPFPSVRRQSINLVLLITMKEVHMILVQLMSRVLLFFGGGEGLPDGEFFFQIGEIGEFFLVFKSPNFVKNLIIVLG
jgi:hypothetical protein